MSAFRGWLGEKKVTLGIWLFLDRKVYRRFHDVIVPTSGGTTQIDHLLISPFGLSVIETKNLKGWIFGSEKQGRWTQSIYGRNYSLQNPLRQNFRHTRALVEYLDLDPVVLHSIVFFVGRCRFKTSMPPNVLRTGLAPYIKRFRDLLLSEDEILGIVGAIQRLRDDPFLNHRNHRASLREWHASAGTCPRCGSDLVRRIARKGSNAGSSFIGCSGFPRCRYTTRA